MDGADLLLDVDALHHLQARAVALLQRRAVVARSGLLAARLLLLGQRLARVPVEQVAALAGEALEVVGYVGRR